MSPAWIIGGSNQVAAFLVPELLRSGRRVVVDSRTPCPPWIEPDERLTWRTGGPGQAAPPADPCQMVYIGPLTAFAEWWPAAGVSHVVAFSSTSRFSKAESGDAGEQAVARQLAAGEATVRAAMGGSPLTLLRPTLIYGAGLDTNLTRLAGWLRRVRVMPLPGPGAGRRQPVHAADLAAAVRAILATGVHGDYTLSGGSTITYREMVARVFRSLTLAPRFVTLPRWAWRPALSVLRLRRRWADLNPAMFERLEADLVFSHEAATRDFGYHPRPFRPDARTWQRLDRRAEGNS